MKFDFRRRLKNLNIKELEELKEYHTDWLIRFIGIDSKAASREMRYLGYIDNAINKIKNRKR